MHPEMPTSPPETGRTACAKTRETSPTNRDTRAQLIVSGPSERPHRGSGGADPDRGCDDTLPRPRI